MDREVTTATNQLIIKLDDIKRRLDVLQTDEIRIKTKLQDFLTKHKLKKYDYKKHLITLNCRTKIDYNIDLLQNKLTKAQLKLITNKKYIVNQEGLIRFIQRYPEYKRQLGEFISVEYEINSNKLEQALEEKKIQPSDLKGCYTINNSEYITYKNLN